jgi:hypothetical protein
VSRRRFYDGAQHRFEAHSRRWKLIQEKGRGSMKLMKDWAAAYLRWENVVARRSMVATALELARPPYEPPTLTAVGNMRHLLAQACPPHDET